MNKVKLIANAKVNLSIDVLQKLENGYHELDMIIQEIDLFDTVSIEKRRDNQVKIHTNWNLPHNSDNIAYKAAQYVKDLYGIDRGYDIVIDKRIPIESGLAGGSSDAAAVIKGMILLEQPEYLPIKEKNLRLDHKYSDVHFLNDETREEDLLIHSFDLYEMCDPMFEKKEVLQLFNEFSLDIAKKIGCDVSFFTRGKTMRVKGIGDILNSIENNLDYYFVIIKPHLNILTKWVYANLKVNEIRQRPNNDAMEQALKYKHLEKMTENMSNVLEDVVLPHYPDIGQIKQQLLQHGAHISLMSGSGSSVFGIFEEHNTAQKAFEALHLQYENIYLCKGF